MLARFEARWDEDDAQGMTGSWKTLGTIAIAAAIAGWLVVRMLAPATPVGPTDAASETPAAREPAVTDAPMADAPQVAAAPPVAPVEGDLPDLDEAFTIIALALGRDRQIEEEMMPPEMSASSVPSSIPYRRAEDFWQPMFARYEGGR